MGKGLTLRLCDYGPHVVVPRVIVSVSLLRPGAGGVRCDWILGGTIVAEVMVNVMVMVMVNVNVMVMAAGR